MRPLPAELERVAREQLNETPERVQQDLIILRSWIAQQPHLRARTNDYILIAFLRFCCFSLEETKRRIDAYYTAYKQLPELFRNRCVTQTILDMNRSGLQLYLDKPHSKNQTTISIARIGQFDTKRYQVRTFLTYMTMILEMIMQENDNVSVAGITQIVDLHNVQSDSLAALDIWPKWRYWVNKCCPVRIVATYVLNPPKEFQLRLSIVRALMPRALTHNPVYVIKHLDELTKHIPKTCLPEEYGGVNGHVAECITYAEELLLSYRNYFEEDALFGTSESLRYAEVPSYEAEFGASGSFRKLSTD